MPTYIVLANWTEQGINNVKDAGKRLTAAKKLMAANGGKVKSFHMTMGGYDVVTIVEAPDDEAMARVALIMGQQGNVRTTTLKAFTETEARKLFASLE